VSPLKIAVEDWSTSKDGVELIHGWNPCGDCPLLSGKDEATSVKIRRGVGYRPCRTGRACAVRSRNVHHKLRAGRTLRRYAGAIIDCRDPGCVVCNPPLMMIVQDPTGSFVTERSPSCHSFISAGAVFELRYLG
jgi:hypothetical protein